MFLFQLQAVLGEWDKALAQLRTLAQLSPEAQMLATVYHQAVEAEKVRASVVAGVARPDVLISVAPWIEDLADAFQAFALGDAATGEAKRDAAFDAVPDMPGELDGVAFDWLADADARFGPALEMIVGGKYGLVPLDAVTQIKCEGPKDLRDLVWLPVQIAFRTGHSAAAFIPARYPGSEASTDNAIRLARATTWRDGASGQEGLGQRLLSLSDGADVDLLSLRKLTLTVPTATPKSDSP